MSYSRREEAGVWAHSAICWMEEEPGWQTSFHTQTSKTPQHGSPKCPWQPRPQTQFNPERTEGPVCSAGRCEGGVTSAGVWIWWRCGMFSGPTGFCGVAGISQDTLNDLSWYPGWLGRVTQDAAVQCGKRDAVYMMLSFFLFFFLKQENLHSVWVPVQQRSEVSRSFCMSVCSIHYYAINAQFFTQFAPESLKLHFSNTVMNCMFELDVNGQMM